nr:nucleotidyltransferase family protein [Granulicatella sp. zg-84]
MINRRNCVRACAIIAEYNPFHNGHAWHIQQAREHSQADVMIAVMSGNFTQRGDLAILNKWNRAKLALSHGVDMVVELPTVEAVQSADFFAENAVRIAHKLQCQFISCGVESGTSQAFQEIAEALMNLPEKDFTQSYHTQVLMYLSQLFPTEMATLISTPNNQLALSYMKAIIKHDYSMQLLPIIRTSAQHYDTQVESNSCFASGTAIRQKVLSHEDYISVVPELSYRTLQNHAVQLKTAYDKYWVILQTIIMSKSLEELRCVYQMVEGIEYRLKKCVYHAESYEHFVELVMNKRWKRARVQRLCLYIVLNIQSQERQDSVRVLAINNVGTRYMKQLKHVDFITQFKKNHDEKWHRQISCDKIYQTLCEQSEQNFRWIERDANEKV